VLDRDVVLAKAALVDASLRRIAEARSGRRSALAPADLEDIIAWNLQRAIQVVLDLAGHVLASERLEPPDSLAQTFTTLSQRGLLEPVLAERLRRMVGFRNVLVHQYQDLDPAVLEAVLTHHQDDLRGFVEVILRRFSIEPSERHA
jgi:uncharacterized protein YutE (UPF0331/DUF86 family)